MEAGFTKNSGVKNWFSFERNEIFLLLSFFFFGVAFANYEPYAPVWLRQIFQEESFLIIGLVAVIPSTMVAIGTTVWGILADKFGTKKFVLLGIIAYTLMFFSLIFTTSSQYFLVIVLIGSLLGSAQSANFYALATKSINKPKEMILAKMTIVISLAWVIMSPLIGWIYDSYSNSMTIQLIIAIIACVITVTFALLIKEVKKDIKEVQKRELKTKKSPLTMFVLIFIGIMILAYIYQITGGFWAYTSIYFLDTLNIKGFYYSFFLIIKTAFAIPLAFLVGNIRKTTRITWIIITFSAWLVIVYLIMMLFPTQWILILIIYSLPMYPIYNVSYYSLVTRFSSKTRRATAYGIFSTLGTLGYISGVLILGVVADNFPEGIFTMLPTSVIFASVAVFFAILFGIIIYLKKKEVQNVDENLEE
jgi:MFS family permease